MKLLAANLHGTFQSALKEKDKLITYNNLARRTSWDYRGGVLSKAEFLEVSLWHDIIKDVYFDGCSRYEFYDFSLDDMNDKGYVIQDDRILGFYRAKAPHINKVFDFCEGFEVTFEPLKIGYDKHFIPEDYSGVELYEVYHGAPFSYPVEKHEFMDIYNRAARNNYHNLSQIIPKSKFIELTLSHDLETNFKVKWYDKYGFTLDQMRDDGYVIQPNKILSFIEVRQDNHSWIKTPPIAGYSVEFAPMRMNGKEFFK